MSKPIDNSIRELAVSELDRNIVVTAGAGTGKTTLLVERMLHVILGHKRFQNEESPIRRVVAMTFTEKAASEMKIRLMGELEKIVAVINGKAAQEDNAKVEKFLAHIRDTYQTTYREVERRARKSLEDMDKTVIGTIHGFAAYILRLYPIESGVVPGFVVDEGDVFDELFDKEWAKWLELELVLSSPQADIWKGVLRRLDLESVKNLARRLSGFTIPQNSLISEEFVQYLEGNLRDGGEKGVVRKSNRIPSEIKQSPPEEDNKSNVQSLLDPFSHKIQKMLPCCEKSNNNLLSQLHALSKILDEIKKQGISYLNTLEYDLDKEASNAKTGWTDEGFETARELIKNGHTLLKKLKTVDDAFVATVIGLISPFAKAFRQTYLSQGYVSFDGLLTLARDLLLNKEYRYIREKLKNELRTILVDEFQDTDPVQYEIVLFLSEALGHHSTDALKVTLEPGKLFIVGDPKQSIYAFRRADIEAYEQVVKQVCGQDETLKLQENFRSHSGIIEVVNRLFDGRIMVEQSALQPCYIPIHANRPKTQPSQIVEIVLVSDKEGKELKADEAREAEAEWIARWIIKHVSNEDIEDKFAENGLRKLKYRDVALLLRAFTQVRPYVEALKRYGIPYIVEGEKYFYTTQEILDFMNLLRALENPHDTIALVGVLRSPIVGLTDREIYELHKNHLLDYRKDISGETFKSHRIMKSDEDTHPLSTSCEGAAGEVNNLFLDLKKIVEPFYGFLRKTHARSGILPVSQLIAEIMDNTHIAEITACAWHGEQKLANLQKLYQMACDMEQSDGVSLKNFIDRIKVRIKEAREEGESPLSDETLDVVKILTIHKSKGLEFPVVFLGNLHGEVRNDKEVLDSAVFDWTTSTTGIVIGKGDQRVRNLQSVIIEKKLNDRSWEEEKRVLYVAMTRAKERLILTGSLKDDDKSYMGLIAQSVRDAAGVELGDETFMNLSHTNEDENVSPSHQGRGNSGDPTSRAGNKTSEEDKPSAEKFPLPLRESVRVRGVSQGKFPLGNAEIFVEHFRFDGTHRSQKITKEKTLDIDWAAFVEIWKKREAAMIEATRNPLFVSPATIAFEESMKKGIPGAPGRTEEMTHLHPDEFEQHRLNNHHLSPASEGGERGEIIKSKRTKPDTEQSHPKHAALIGSICHRILEGWDFHGTSQELQRSIESAVKWANVFEKCEVEPSVQFFGEDIAYQEERISSPYEGGDKGEVSKQQEISFNTIQFQDVEFIKAEVVKILSVFTDSEAYKELQAAQILGREVPILLNWDGQIMRGTIDILYKIDDRVIIADYKTDHVTMTDLPAKAEKYRYQKEVYVEAVKRCLKIDNPEFKLFFLRLGKAISV
ncbi:MAG: CRISPR-associated exonuclease Cas4 [Planctomycetota bacterium]|nr:CRISPR-associated exonuclease Cas4 [Planctomycetota bacterium]